MTIPTRSGRLDRARREIATSLEELRDVARGLHPAVVSGHGLEVALEQLAARGPGAGAADASISSAGCPSASRSRPTTSSPRASPTSASTRTRRPPPSTSRAATTSRRDRGRRRRRRRRRHRAGIRPARSRRPRRGARRPAAGLEPDGRRHPCYERRSHARRDRRGQRAPPRGARAPARRERVRRRRQLRDGRRAARRCAATSPTWRSSTSGCRRRTTTRGCGRRSRSAPRHPEVGVLVLSQYVELGLAMKLLADSAEGAGYLLKDRISDVKEFVGGRASRRGGRLGDRPDHRLDAPLQAAERRPARRR